MVNLVSGELKHLCYLGKGEVLMRDLLYVGGPVSQKQSSVPEILLLGFRLLCEGLRHGIV